MELKKNSFFRTIMYYTARFISVINKCIPKNANLYLFYDSNSPTLCDNTEAIFQYISKHNDGTKKLIQCIPNSPNTNTYREIIKGIYTFLRAKYVFYSFGDFRISPSSKQIVVFQNHGMPLKSIGKLTGYDVYVKEKLNNFSFATVTAPMFVDIYMKAYGCGKEQIKILGQARNDYFYSSRNGLENIPIVKSEYKKIVLWMPTFRQTKTDKRFKDGTAFSEETGLPLISTQLELEQLDKYLNDLDVLLCIKLHPYSELRNNNLKNIVTLKNSDILPKGIKLYEFVKEFDALISDYSSISWDYILLDRPMGFTLDDIGKYSRGFSIENPLEYMPGHHIYTINDLQKFFKDVATDNDLYAFERNKVCKITNTYNDNNNCKRLLDACGINLNTL